MCGKLRAWAWGPVVVAGCALLPAGCSHHHDERSTFGVSYHREPPRAMADGGRAAVDRAAAVQLYGAPELSIRTSSVEICGWHTGKKGAAVELMAFDAQGRFVPIESVQWQGPGARRVMINEGGR
jgi:hypothetical protein